MEKDKNNLATEFYEKALNLEHQKEFVEAKKNYELAFTTDPVNKEAEQGILRMTSQLQALAEKHFLKSTLLHKKGKYNEERRSLLISLRLWPEHIKARQALMANENLNIQKYINHNIENGKTRSKIYKTLAIEFFKDQQFNDAIVEFKKVLSANPNDKETMNYISDAYFQMGSTETTQNKLLEALEHFQSALNYNKNCDLCITKLAQTKDLYKEFHYKAGMKSYNEQNLIQAILEWELVQKMDMEYKKITELLEKAKTIQKNIEAIKKSE